MNDFTINGVTVQVNAGMRNVYRRQYRLHLAHTKTNGCPLNRRSCKQTWLNRILMRQRQAALRCD